MKPRLLRTKTGIRVLHSNRCDPIVLPPVVPIPTRRILSLTAEDMWTAHIDLPRELCAARANRAVCPLGARLIPLEVNLNPKAEPFAIVDEEDYERVARHSWRAIVRNGETRAVTDIEGTLNYEMGRFVMGVRHRYIRVQRAGQSFDNRRSKLVVISLKMRHAQREAEELERVTSRA